MKKRNETLTTANYYVRHVRAYPRRMYGILFSIPLTVLVNNYLPQLIAATVLSRLSQHNYQNHQIWHDFGPQLVLYAGLITSGVLAWRLVDYFMWRLEAAVSQDMAEEVFDTMIHESADFHANNFAGSLVSHTNKLLSGYVRIADTTIYQVYPLLAGLLFTTVILLPRAPLFVAIFLAFTIIYLLLAFKISKPVQRLSAKFAATESKQTGALADAITNVMAIKSFARGTYEKQRFHESTSNTRRQLMQFARSHQRQMNYLGGLSRSISAASLTIAVVSVVVYHINIGTMFLILSYTAGIVDQLFQFSNNSLRNYSRSFGDAKDMVTSINAIPKIQDPVTPEPSTIRQGTIDFKDVTFTHDGSDDALFQNFTVHIANGEKVGLVGHSGSGKSTFTRLLLRFSDIQSGEILIDGQNIAAIKQDDLHSTIAYVPQEPLLFHRTITENIGYGTLNPSAKQITRAAGLAHATEFIDTLPKGYDTLVGERGVKLSGGQRQRIAIARAMLKNAPILLLDEATSALDSESEVLIQDALWKLMEGKTAVVIAHRLSTIQKMDRIIVLDDGKIVEQGSHTDLLKKDGTYAKLWAHQSGGFIDE